MNDSINKFEQFLYDNGKSELTVDSYINDIDMFVKYLNSKGSIQDYDTEFHNYIDFLYNNKKLKTTTINRKIISIRQFLNFYKHSTSMKLKKIQQQNFLDDILDNEEISSMIHICEKRNDIRAKCLILTLFYTGMRISEALQLTIHDINKDYIEIIGKGSKHRMVFVPQKLKLVWKEYMKVRYDKKQINNLFVGQKGAMTRYKAHTIMKEYGELANIDLNKCFCHSARHLYCKNLVKEGVSLDAVRQLAGHSSILTTQVYTQRTRRELLDIINKL